ncbi:GPI inositol-deacylase [Actinidia chinensis var. chinensis]|uniref:GPI inositol-deacylase n=2 Tax=Actinidia TaxID=3624 RepID=A0A2R6RJG4_ACTCC|nr:GPI inositol-deacylase [Actinidia chinensis var. chinensis]
MQGCKSKCRVAALVTISIWIGLAALYDLVKPISNGCIMTYMYPQYIPIASPANISSSKYGLYLYHEGWKKIDFNERLKKINGVPVLFIPGNGGSYKQVRSLAAESNRAYQGGPLERTFYQEASLNLKEGRVEIDTAGFGLPNQYISMLDWFAVDLEGEHSAMDGRILEEHTEYVVYAIHRILDQYKDSHDARAREGASVSGNLPKSVILVGHSMGGFVARAAIVHPHLRKSSVETVLTLSSPHQSPPVALQPSLGQYYARVNQEWRKGYEVQTSRTGRYVSDPPLSRIVVVSISGGIHDYQVRTKLESLAGIVPPSHGFLISSTAMKNVWLSMEHQVILWCNQLVVQVSHTLLSLMDPETGQPFYDTQKRLAVFTKMLHSAIPQSFNWFRQSLLPQQATPDSIKDGKEVTGSHWHTVSACPSNVHWTNDGLERDLYIQTTTVTVLAMDGRRRWLDIEKLGSNGQRHFILVTNLAPCSGIRLHLWPEKGKSATDLPGSKGILEVTQKMMHIPSGPAPRQIEPGSQTEQAPPSAVFLLAAGDMRGFRFLTISVAPSPAVSGKPPPAASMAVGQFFSPKDGELEFSPKLLLLSAHSPKDVTLNEDHPLALNMSFTISSGLLPVKLSVKTTGCGIKKSALPIEEAGDVEQSRLCKLRCFPPVALAWDATSGLHIFPNLYSEIIVVDSSPALWSSTRGSEKTSILLLVFLLLYYSEIAGFSIAVVFFALMRQAHAWELDSPIPSMLSAVESNLRFPLPFLFLVITPLFIASFISFLTSQSFPPFVSFFLVSIVCYLFANGSIILLILAFQLVFYVAAVIHVFIKTRWQLSEENFCFVFLHWFFNLSSVFLSFKVVRVLRAQLLQVTALVAITLVCFVHPALGLFILLLYHALSCHITLSCHAQSKELFDSRNEGYEMAEQFVRRHSDGSNQHPMLDESCSSTPDSTRSFGETQLEMFHHQHGLLMLHFLATLMFVPSLVAWLQRMGMSQSFPWFVDSALCIGVIFHGICDSKPEFNFFLFPFLGIPGLEVKLSFAYLLAGYYSYLSALALAPYQAFYAMAAIGFISLAFRIIQRQYRKKGEAYFRTRKHSHRQ